MRLRWLSKRALLLHLALCLWVPGCLIAGWWQVHRAMSGNALSYLYSIEWPAFALAGVYAWWLLVHIDATTPGRTPAEQLAAARHAAAAAAAERRSTAASRAARRTDTVGDLLVAQRQAAAHADAVTVTAGAGGLLASAAPSRVAPRPRASPRRTKPDERREREVDEQLAAYNERLARLATDGPKTWRQR